MTPIWLRWLGFAAGIFVVVGTAGSLMRALVVPRGLSSKFGALVARITRKVFLFIANRFDDYERKDKILALQAPVFLIVLLMSWMLAFFIGYALILYPLVEGLSFLEALRDSGSSMFTLGFAFPPHPGAAAVGFIAALTGLIVIALQIAYLPTLYGAFNRRETLVTMLQSRAGSPAWGPEILARHQMVGLMSDLPNFYAEWERWAADLTETHTNYIVLLYFRSPHPLRSWLLALLSVMDAAALQMSLDPEGAPVQARLCMRMGFVCLRNIADVLSLPYDPDPLPDDPIELTYEEFLGGVDRLREMNFEMHRTPEEAWPHFKGWRVNYESLAYRLADLVVAPPGPWSGPRTHLPELSILPQRPVNRTPDDSHQDEPKMTERAWHA